MKKFLMTAFAGVFAVLFLCGWTSNYDTPKKAFNEFRDAIVAKDVEKLAARVYDKDIAPEKLEAFVRVFIEVMHKNHEGLISIKKSKVVDVKVNGNQAIITVKSGNETDKVKAIKINGGWKINMGK